MGPHFYLYLLLRVGLDFLTAWWLGFERAHSKKKHPGAQAPYHLGNPRNALPRNALCRGR